MRTSGNILQAIGNQAALGQTASEAASGAEPPRRGAGDTGIPEAVKQSFEQRSGFSFDDVKVHYNSEKPARYQALAYTQGNQVYMGPGQEKYLAHELGHVVQQKAGRVRATGSVGGQPLNDDKSLEREADRW